MTATRNFRFANENTKLGLPIPGAILRDCNAIPESCNIVTSVDGVGSSIDSEIWKQNGPTTLLLDFTDQFRVQVSTVWSRRENCFVIRLQASKIFLKNRSKFVLEINLRRFDQLATVFNEELSCFEAWIMRLTTIILNRIESCARRRQHIGTWRWILKNFKSRDNFRNAKTPRHTK